MDLENNEEHWIHSLDQVTGVDVEQLPKFLKRVIKSLETNQTLTEVNSSTPATQLQSQ